MSESMRVFSPTASCYNKPRDLRRTLDGLKGKTVGFIDNAKPNFSFLVDDLERLLITEYGVARVLKRSKFTPSIPAPDALMKELIGQCDAVITGSGD